MIAALSAAGVNVRQFALLGTQLWDDPKIFANPLLEGGWYPAPDPAGFRAFAERYRGRYLIENAFCRLKDFRRVHTRYDKLAANFLSGVALATAMAFWL